MNVKSIVGTTLEISDYPGLDPVRVMIYDIGEGSGRVVIECFGQAWAGYWGAMGTSLRDFFVAAPVDYLCQAMRASERNVKKSDRDYLTRIIRAVQEALRTMEPAKTPEETGKSVEFEFSGGDIWTLEEPGPDGHAKTVISIEAPRDAVPFIIDQQRPLTKPEVEALMKCLHENLCAPSN